MCKGLYSPKIKEALIPYIHAIAKELDVPMTEYVSEVLERDINDYLQKGGQDGQDKTDA